MQIIKNICNYRELLKSNVKKDIRGRYKGSFLGVLWSFINPLLQVVVYWIVFPYLFRGAGIDNYLVYLITGIIPWNFFLVVITGGTTAIKANAGIIKKVYFPREILLISQVLSGLVNFLISCIIILIFCMGTGEGISIYLVTLPLLALIQAILNLGLIFILGAINVYVQDIEHIVGFVLQMGFYATPVIYSLSMLPTSSLLYKLISLNPMTIIINAYRDAFLYQCWPNFLSLFGVLVFSVLVLVIGYFIFRRLEKGFAEVL